VNIAWRTYLVLLVAGQQLNDGAGGISFWSKKCHRFLILAPFALDILPLPASEASAERVFSHYGDLTRGKCNRNKNHT